MAMKKSWFGWVRRLFVSEQKPKAVKARKALRAPKGLVKLQAIVRGQVVRRQALIKMKHLPSNAKMRSKSRQKALLQMDFVKAGKNDKRETQTDHMERGNGLLEESQLAKESGRQSHQIKQWPDKEAYNRERMENLKSAPISNFFTGDIFSPAQVKTRSTRKQDFIPKQREGFQDSCFE
ncbi:hypothetical protein NC651_035031 [Populus alba x Populus x berolinensis]|nr:hypothetical protein NC651_035031 [Populus alba x Populus x berolinensis]